MLRRRQLLNFRLLFQRAVEALLGTVIAAAIGLPARGQIVISGPYSGTQIPGDVSIAANTSATFTQGAGFTGTNATLGNSAFLNWNQGGTLSAKSFSVGTNAGIIIGSSGSLTLDGASSVTGGVWVYSDNPGAALVNQGSITHNTGTGYVYAPAFTNSGSIAATSGSNLYVGYTPGYSITNASGGTITADGTNTSISLVGVANQGVVTAQNGGTLNFRGNNTTSNLGAVQIGTGGGHAYLVGAFDNNGTALAGPAGGSYELLGGTINGGTIAPGSSAGPSLAFTSSGGVLNNVSYQDNLTLGTGATVILSGSTNITGTTVSLGTNASVGWSLNGSLLANNVVLGSNASIGVGAGNSLTIGSATAVTGDAFIYSNAAGASITNQGGIHHTAGTGYLYAPTFLNQGSIASGAGTTLFLGYTAGYSITNGSGGTVTADGANAAIYLQGVNNQGTLTAQNGGILYFRGANTTANLGAVAIGAGGGHAYLTGTLDNTGGILNAPTGGTFELSAGTITNGGIAAGALTFTSGGGTLSNVTLNGDLTLPAYTNVAFANGTAFTGTNASLGSGAWLNWNQSGRLTSTTLALASGSSVIVGAGNALTLDTTTSASGDITIYSNAAGASLTNNGTINHTTGVGYLYAPTFTNQGAVTAGANTNLYVGSTPGYSSTNGAGGTITADGANAAVYLNAVTNSGIVTAQNGGALYLQGSINRNQLGNVTIGAGGGHAYLAGTLDNTGGTLNAPNGGSYELAGGTVASGTVGPGALNFTSWGGTLNGVTYSGDLTLPTGSYVNFTNGTGLTGSNVTLGPGAGLYWNQSGTITGKTLALGSNAYLSSGAGNSLTLDASTVATGDVAVYSNGTGTAITNLGTILHTTGTGYLYAPTFTNRGSITAGPGTNLWVGYYNNDTTTNASGGTITADGAAASLYTWNLLNQGTVTVQNGGALYVGGNYPTSSLGAITFGTGGGHAYLTNTLDNSGATLTAPTGGSYELDGGTITNGTIAAGALTFTGSNGTLSNVAYSGDLALPASAAVTLTNGTTFSGTNASLGGSAGLYWNQNATLVGKALTLGQGSYVYIGSGNTLTLDGATTVTGDVQMYSSYPGSSLTNLGSITHNLGTGYIFAPTLANQGGITATAGGSLYYGYYSGETTTNGNTGTLTADGAGTTLWVHDLVNQGAVTVQNGGSVYFWGANRTSDLGNVTLGPGGGHAYLYTTLDNSGATLTAPTGGSFELYAGTITNGTVAPGALTFTGSGGILSNVTYSGDLGLPTYAFTNFTAGTTFTGTNATLGNYSNLYWYQNGTLAGKSLTFGTGASIYLGANNALTLDSATTASGDVVIYSGNAGTSVTNQGTINHTTGTGSLYAETFTNQGAINVGNGTYLYLGASAAGFTFANTATGSINVNGGYASLVNALTNAGVINVQSGTLYTAYSSSNLTNGPTGTIQGSGTIVGNLTLAGGTVSPGNSIGTLTIASGGLIVTAPATLAMELSGTVADQLLIQAPPGAVDIGAGLLTLNLTLLGAPTASTYPLLTIANGTGFTGYFAGLPISGNTITASYLGSPYTFSIQYSSTGASLNFAAIPEPGTVALLVSGIITLGAARWSRRRRHE